MNKHRNSNLDSEIFFGYNLFNIEDMIHTTSDPIDILAEIEKYTKKFGDDQEPLEDICLGPNEGPPNPSTSLSDSRELNESCIPH